MDIETHYKKEHIFGYIISLLQYIDTRQYDYIRKTVLKTKIRIEIYNLINSDIDKSQIDAFFEWYKAFGKELSCFQKKIIMKKVEKFLCLDGSFDDKDKEIFFELFNEKENCERVEKCIRKERKRRYKSYNACFTDTTKNVKQDLCTLIDKSRNMVKRLENIFPQLEEVFLNYSNWLETNSKIIEKIDNNVPTVAFFGRTKAGKSTLFYALSNKCKEFIGKGGQRNSKVVVGTYINGIRFIDTPGVDAGTKKGRDDEKRALDAISYADCACIVISNDTIKIEKYIEKFWKNEIPSLIVTNNKGIDFAKYNEIVAFVRSNGAEAIKDNAYLSDEIKQLKIPCCSVWAKAFVYCSADYRYKDIRCRLLVMLNRKKILKYSGLIAFADNIKTTTNEEREKNRKTLLNRILNQIRCETSKMLATVDAYIEAEKCEFKSAIRLIEECMNKLEEFIDNYFDFNFFTKYDDDYIKKRFGKLSDNKYKTEMVTLIDEIIESNNFNGQINSIIKKYELIELTEAQEKTNIVECENKKEKRYLYGSDIKKGARYVSSLLGIGAVWLPVLSVPAIVLGMIDIIPTKERKVEIKKLSQERCDEVKKVVASFRDNYCKERCIYELYKQKRQKEKELDDYFNEIETTIEGLKKELEWLEAYKV